MLTVNDKLNGTDIAIRVNSPSKSEYTVVRWAATGSWSCNCIGWILHMSKRAGGHLVDDFKNHCAHIVMVLDNFTRLSADGRFTTRPRGKRGSYELTVLLMMPGRLSFTSAPPVVALPISKAVGRAIARDGEEI